MGFELGYKDGICKSTYPLAFKKGKQEAVKEFINLIDKMLAERLNGERYNFFINGEELKIRIKGEKDVKQQRQTERS